MERLVADLQFPLGGLHRRYAYQAQPPQTTPDALNVRPASDGLEGRRAGGSRPGVGKYSETQFVSGPIRLLKSITWVDGDQIKTRLVIVSGGSLYLENAVGAGGGVIGGISGSPSLRLPDTTFSTFGAAIGTLNPNKNLQASSRDQLLYIADHADNPSQSQTTYYPKKFNPAAGTLSQWTATDGTLPLGCNCICTWRDRLVLAGGTTDPYGVFMSRQSDPDDWDFSEEDTGAAVDLAIADAGQIGDVVTCLAPHTDNCLIIGGHTSLWILRNDPGYGGILDNLSQQIGVVDRGAYCVTPEGLMVFLSRDGLYAVPASCTAARFPEPISRNKLPRELLAVDRTTHTVSMAFDVLDRGIHLYITPNTAGTSAARSWFLDWDSKDKTFWPVELASPNFEPFVLHERENFSDVYSAVVMGCRDGYIRRFRWELTKDDGIAFPSHVLLGPLGDPTQTRDTLIAEVTATLAQDSGDVFLEIASGDSPQQAALSVARPAGRLRAGRNATKYPRKSAQSHYLVLRGAEDGHAWGYDSGSATFSHVGRSRP